MSAVAVERARQQALQALENYTSAVVGPTAPSGGTAPPPRVPPKGTHWVSSISRPPGSYPSRLHYPPRERNGLYRSNSSLDLEYEQDGHMFGGERPLGVPLSPRREYGSHGSLDVVSAGGESFFAMLREYKPDGDQRSPAPPRIAEYLRGRMENTPTTENANNELTNGVGDTVDGADYPGSPKLRLKLNRFWGDRSGGGEKERQSTKKGVGSRLAGANGAINPVQSAPCTPVTDASLLKKFRGSHRDESVTESSIKKLPQSLMMDLESLSVSTTRRRSLSHLDCQSVCANLSYAARRRALLALRRNTATGASAASCHLSNVEQGVVQDAGDGNSNSLVMSCPFFRNEVGGEEERSVALSRLTARRPSGQPPLHRPVPACGLSVLDPSGLGPQFESHWRSNCCPCQRQRQTLENVDWGALYYKHLFYGQEHSNWFGVDDNLGPVSVSVKRERVDGTEGGKENVQHQFRIIIRTSELLTLRGTILENTLPGVRGSKGAHAREVLEYVAPELQLSCLRQGLSNPQTEEQLLKLDQQGLSNRYKVGILYCRSNQSTEEEMYNNEEGGAAFDEFLTLIGQRVRLKGFDKYKAGLDNKNDSTGTHSVFAQYQDCEVMFHVSTLLPFTPNNKQQLLRKRHIGNDIVTIVFQEPGALPFTPKNIRSQFQHVFLVIRVINPCSENTQYSVAVSRSKEVSLFGPPIPEGATFSKSKVFVDFLLAKVINAENAAHRSEKFATMATRTRQEYLKDLATNYVTSTTMESNSKFPLLSFSSKKKDRQPPRVSVDLSVSGALCWQVILEDCGLAAQVDCFLSMSTDTMAMIEESTGDILFAIPCSCVLGWTVHEQSVQVFYHQGESICFHISTPGDEDVEGVIGEVIGRLLAVTKGKSSQELVLRRNLVGQLGFHVQQDGVVTEVESTGFAWQAGLRQGSRLVEICKVSVSTLSQEQMVDLLKTSVTVTVSVIPPLQDGLPRRGCPIPNCTYGLYDSEGDYENLKDEDISRRNNLKPATHQQAVPGRGHNQKRFDPRGVSPPRSSNSSGYGTGSSSKSFGSTTGGADTRQINGNQISGSAPQSLGWYEGESELVNHNKVDNPPPLPSRGGNSFQPLFGREGRLPVAASHSVGSGVCNNKEKDVPWREHISSNKEVQQINGLDRPSLPPSYSLVQHHRLSALKSCSLPPDCVPVRSNDGGRSNDGENNSDRGHSEDDSSASSSRGHSPLSRPIRAIGTKTTTNSSSSSSSPLSRDCGEPRLRSGRNSNRNSANLAASSLQEDLLRLINPEYLQPEGERETEEPPLPPRDILTMNSTNSIVTTARPATVVSNTSTNSSPAPSEARLSKEERLSPRATTGSPKSTAVVAKVKPLHPSANPSLPLPADEIIDWPSLVDTATKAIATTNERTGVSLPPWVNGDDGSTRLQIRELQARVNNLENRLQREQHHTATVETENRRLQDENRRLQDESQTAAQQLRRFTEWFFHTIDQNNDVT